MRIGYAFQCPDLYDIGFIPANIGIGEVIDINNIQDPIIGFIFSQKGLIYNRTLEDSKFTKLGKKPSLKSAWFGPCARHEQA